MKNMEELVIRVLLYAGVCYLIQVLFKLFSKQIIPKFSNLPEKQQNVWYNKAVSTFHAIVMLYRAVNYWLLLNPTFQIAEHVSKYEAITIDLMMGYLVYDTCYETLQGGSWDVSILGHHVIGFISHFLTRYLNNGSASFYSMMVYLAELSTPFLNISWLLNYLKLDNSFPLTLCGLVLLFTFFCCRVAWGPYLLWHMIMNWKAEPRYLFHINVGIVIFFVVLNYYWFSQLIRVLFGKKKEGKVSKNE